jgi:TetR/AcrR family transcriptional regulator, cholesterol catabolism regulator
MDSEARWEEILEAAGKIFYEKGYEGTSLQDIASAVGMLKGSIYYYIKTKEDLLYELVTRAQLLFLTTLEEDEQTAAAPAPERLSAFIGRWMALSAKHRGVVAERDFIRLSGRRLKVVIGRRDQFSTFVKNIISQGIDEGAFDPAVDPSLATNAVFDLMQSSRRWHRSTGRLTMEALGDWYTTFVIRGLGGPAFASPPSTPARRGRRRG